MQRAAVVAHERPPDADLLDLALEVLDHDGVALEVLPLDEDQDPHQVVEDDALPGKGDRGDDDAEPGEERPEVEDREDDQDHDEDVEEAEGPIDEVLDRLDPPVRLGEGGRIVALVGGLETEDPNQDPVERWFQDACGDHQDDDAEDHGDEVIAEPRPEVPQRLLRVHRPDRSSGRRFERQPTGSSSAVISTPR